MRKEFDITLNDSQGTKTIPIEPKDFDFDCYSDYECKLLERNKKFVQSKEGILVYRRFRAEGVFYGGCRDMKTSLESQLGALKESMKYKADVANFLEPWYGIGYIASAFGGKYTWNGDSSPSTEPMFNSFDEALSSDTIPLSRSPLGKHILEMIEYFLDKTKGKVPISFSDIQAPLNMMSYLFNMADMFMQMYDSPEKFKQVANMLTDLLIEFLKEQEKLIGSCLAKPGHGFASSREFTGVGLSNDNSLMISQDDFNTLVMPFDEKIGDEFGGTVYHSCGNWGRLIDVVKKYRNVVTVDGAFGVQTDPIPNDPEEFGKHFCNSGIILNARVVGDSEEVIEQFRKIYKTKMKLIAVTYCKTPEEQEKAYDLIHQLRYC